ncbi:MAG: cation-transporting P-type ATPase, partial [Candidatus Caldarchaeum sp.]
MASFPKNLHHLTVQQALSQLNTDGERGLSSEEAAKRLKEYGPNLLEPVPKPSPLKIFLKQFANMLIGLLIAALLISGFLGEVVDSIVIGVIVFFVAIVG